MGVLHIKEAESRGDRAEAETKIAAEKKEFDALRAETGKEFREASKAKSAASAKRKSSAVSSKFCQQVAVFTLKPTALF
ncbi:uncharacterized protein YALI1_F18812g [Yarrowia lipolytica]|uniref:Uncharacterized protein n=1 Tax=Yarrowia lipolytica TaxID=4952 RepID=A0A1D8NNC7_YARLL|nr:hypothetical protein YALI1_F18812g [Yarrowia lipolytica]